MPAASTEPRPPLTWTGNEATADRPAQWQGDFDKMLAYAASKGWMDAAGAVVKAHIEIV